MVCYSCSCVGYWIIGILANALFVGAIAGTLKLVSWPLSFCVSLLYCSVLGLWIRKVNSTLIESPEINGASESNQEIVLTPAETGEDAETPAESNADENSPTTTRPSPFHSSAASGSEIYPVYLSLLYALLAIAIGAPGLIFAFGVAPCGHYEDSYVDTHDDNSKGTWITNETVLPPAILQWDKINLACRGCKDPTAYTALQGNKFYYRANLDSPIENHKTGLMVMDFGTALNTSRSQRLVTDKYLNPQFITAVNDEYLCFASPQEEDRCFDALSDLNRIVCGKDGETFKDLQHKKGIIPTNFIAHKDQLWYQQTYPASGYGVEEANGYAIVSLDPATMNRTFYSKLILPTDGHQNEDEGDDDRRRHLEDIVGFDDAVFGDDNFYVSPEHEEDCDYFASVPRLIALLVLSALPVSCYGGYLWFWKAVPTSPIVFFFGLGYTLTCIFSLFDPWEFPIVFMPYAAIVASLWIVVAAYILTVSSKNMDHIPMWWSLYFLTFAAFSTVTMTLVFNEEDAMHWSHDEFFLRDVFGTAFVATAFCFLPLIIIGIMLGSLVIYAEGVIGIIVEVVTVTVVLSGIQANGAAVVAGILEVLVLSAVAIWVGRKRTYLRSLIQDKCLRCNRRICGHEILDDNADLLQATESLLMEQEEPPQIECPENVIS